MSNSKTSDRSTWVVQREYQDSFGIVQTEYRDTQGNLHIEATDPSKEATSYENGYVDGGLAEGINQNQQLKREQQADRNISKGLLIGVIVACVAGMSAGVGYYLFQLNQPSAPLVVTMPINKNKPVPSPSPPVVEQSVTTPAQPVKPEPQDVNVTIKTQPADPKLAPTVAPKVSVKPTPAIAPPAKPTASTAPVVLSLNVPIADSPAPTVAQTDARLKTELVKKFNQQFARNQLFIDVNQGNVKISGTVTSPAQLEQIQPLLQSTPGVNIIDVNVTVSSPAN